MADDKWYTRRSDLYHVDPREIVIVAGWNPRNPANFALDDIMPSIRESGVLVPLRIRRNKDGALELRDGERRYRAVMALIAEGCEILSVPCILEKSANDADLLINAILANTGKRFEPMEEAEALRRFTEAWGWPIDKLAARLGKSPSYVRASLALLDAAPAVIAALAEGTIGKSEAVAVVREARQTDTDQGALLDARQEAKRERKARKAGVPAPEPVVLDTTERDGVTLLRLTATHSLAWAVATLAREYGAEEIIDAVHAARAKV